MLLHRVAVANDRGRVVRSFLLLLKIQLLGLFGINKAFHADAQKAKRTLALASLAVAAIVVLVVAYSSGIAMSLVTVGMTEYIPLVAVFVGAAAGAVATFLKTNGILFSFKDYDVVMSLPVSITSVVMSRIASLYSMCLACCVLVTIPAFVVYGENATLLPGALICMVLSIVLAPLLPFAGAVVLAALISAISARFKHASILVIVLSVVATLAILVGTFALAGKGGNLSSLSVLGSQMATQISSLLPPVVWAADGIVRGDMLAFAAFAMLSLAAALLLVAVLVRVFVPVNALLMSSRPRGTFSFERNEDKKKGESPAHAPFRALVAKELRLLVATPIYVLNTCIGYVLVLMAALAALVAKFAGMMPLDMLPPEYLSLVGGFLPWVLAFFVGMSSTTAPSMSLEGSARWLMFTAPVSARVILGAKAAVNLLFALPTIVISGLVLAFVIPLDAVSMVALFVAPLALALFSTFVGLALDARFPRYDWTAVYEPVKRGVPVFVVVMSGMVLVFLGVVSAALFGMAVSLLVSLVIAGASLALFRETARGGLRR